jgi:hypothetical protein
LRTFGALNYKNTGNAILPNLDIKAIFGYTSGEVVLVDCRSLNTMGSVLILIDKYAADEVLYSFSRLVWNKRVFTRLVVIFKRSVKLN